MSIYADNAATTKISKNALEVMNKTAENCYGNPSSVHSHGQMASSMLYKARTVIGTLVGASLPEEIVFTSGGSESNTQAIMTGAAYGEKYGKTKIISSSFEHHSVLNALESLKRRGFEIVFIDPDRNGIVQPQALEDAIDENTALVTIMTANNEIGTLQPISALAKIAHSKSALFHTDAVQAIGHVPFSAKEFNVDMMSASAHKFHGPKGVGILYVKAGLKATQVIYGGHQENNSRPGTENLPGIAAMAAALKDSVLSMQKNYEYISSLRKKLTEELLTIPNTLLNGDTDNRVPGIMNFVFEGIEGEALLLMLDSRDISVSSGSACTAGSLDPSHVLKSIGLPEDLTHGSIRISLSEDNTEEEVDIIAKAIKECVTKLRDMSETWQEIQSGIRKSEIE
ncbi:MAG: cysteine desulfurase [Clostridiales bacterium]|nr:cysteine desulfurase [Clostridiales bacterium]